LSNSRLFFRFNPSIAIENFFVADKWVVGLEFSDIVRNIDGLYNDCFDTAQYPRKYVDQ